MIELVWLHAVEQEPPLLMDAAFASFVELGRRGTQKHVQPKRVELKRPPEPTGAHEDYFKCPVRFRARRNALVLRLADLDLPFVSYNAELLELKVDLPSPASSSLSPYKDFSVRVYGRTAIP